MSMAFRWFCGRFPSDRGVLKFVHGDHAKLWRDRLKAETVKPEYSKENEGVVISMIENLTGIGVCRRDIKT